MNRLLLLSLFALSSTVAYAQTGEPMTTGMSRSSARIEPTSRAVGEAPGMPKGMRPITNGRNVFGERAVPDNAELDSAPIDSDRYLIKSRSTYTGERAIGTRTVVQEIE